LSDLTTRPGELAPAFRINPALSIDRRVDDLDVRPKDALAPERGHQPTGGSPTTRTTDVAIIGCGPYGLSLASYLKSRGVDFTLIGSPMRFWREAMPEGMKLKSEGFASSIADPLKKFTLGDFCREQGLPYQDTNLPVPLERFIAYGEAFQRRYAPDAIEQEVVSLAAAGKGFRLILEDGRIIAAAKVVVAAGIRSFAYMPEVLAALPCDRVSHSADFGDTSALSGRRVVVVGAGASATDVAVSLKKTAGELQIVARRPAVRFQDPLGQRTLPQQIRAPMTGLGPGWKSVLCVRAPLLFHAMPESFRVEVVRRYLGPGPAWHTRSELEGQIPIEAGCDIEEASAQDSSVRLKFTQGGERREIEADHVVAATGFRVDIDRLSFLDESLKQKLARVEGAPALGVHFETSVPGLYFVGAAAANSFGPLLRFVYGSGFASKRVSDHIASRLRRRKRPAAVAGSS
jgi:thioredoxin reductase